jgi:gp16 family phage-associated protein
MITPEQLKADFAARGETYVQWAKDHGYPDWAVYRVINGMNKARRGRAHEIAVKLGLKDDPNQAA